jgi:cell division protein FtsI/penicillin-binding protein 2
MQQPISMQHEMLRRRLPIVVAGLITISVIMVIRMISFQAPQDPRVTSYVQALRDANYGTTQVRTSPRGIIYDRNGQPLAVNTLLYRIGISPGLIGDREAAIQSLSVALNLDPLAVSNIVSDTRSVYRLLATNVEPDTWRRVDALNYTAIQAEQIPRRYYPQGDLASQLIGLVGGGAEDLRGYNGVEGYYQGVLTGQTRSEEVSNLPFDVPADDSNQPIRGADLVLTLDRDVQFLIETELRAALDSTGAPSGTIIVMNPNTGDILGMASFPTYNANEIPNDARLLRNPAISDVYEPGSVFKVLTVAGALEEGVVTPDWTYVDQGVFPVGGEEIRNWDGVAHGVVDLTTALVDSLNIGMATIAVEEMGRDAFYARISAFGIGERTRVDLEGEEAGNLRIPGDPIWSESDLATNSFGQGVAVTPLQMLNAVNVIANGGLLMQPRVVSQVVRGTEVENREPVVIRRVLSPETARTVREMMIRVVNEGVDGLASVPGYTVAGKTGTAQIFTPIGPDSRNMMTFIGIIPGDDPQISVLVKLDRPTSGQFASQTAAPVFARLAERLVLMLEIPTDEVRSQLAAKGGVIGGIHR